MATEVSGAQPLKQFLWSLMKIERITLHLGGMCKRMCALFDYIVSWSLPFIPLSVL